MTRVKICGITCSKDARVAALAGADAIGFVFVPDSPRTVAADVAATIESDGMLRVGVFVDSPIEAVKRVVEQAALDVVQLHGDESPGYCLEVERPVWKRFDVRAGNSSATLLEAIRPYDVDAHLFDPGAGTGRSFAWASVRPFAAKAIVAGGLDPANVARAVREARPWGVDVSSGVESAPGTKDSTKVRTFIESVRREDQDHET